MALMHVGANQGHFVIINLQRTEYDHLSRLRIFHNADEVMSRLVSKLMLESAAPSVITRYVSVTLKRELRCVDVWTHDKEGVPFACASSFELATTSEKQKVSDHDTLWRVVRFALNDEKFNQVDLKITWTSTDVPPLLLCVGQKFETSLKDELTFTVSFAPTSRDKSWQLDSAT